MTRRKLTLSNAIQEISKSSGNIICQTVWQYHMPDEMFYYQHPIFLFINVLSDTIRSIRGTLAGITCTCVPSVTRKCCHGSVNSSKFFLFKHYDHTSLKIFLYIYSAFDLYTKSDSLPDIDALTPYYQSLIDKYIPGVVRWWNFYWGRNMFEISAWKKKRGRLYQF